SISQMSKEDIDNYAESTVFRCMNGLVFVCNYGANIPCGGRPDTRRRMPEVDRYCRQNVTAQVGWTGHDRRRDFARPDGSWVKPLMMFQPCFLAVEKKERMTAKSVAPSSERKPPEIFWRSFIMRPSRSA